jgi:hypothetical protein
MAAIGEVYIGARIPTALNERLGSIARREHNHVSSVVRRLLSDGVDREEKAREQVSAAPRKRAS